MYDADITYKCGVVLGQGKLNLSHFSCSSHLTDSFLARIPFF
uniref:Uncharacterized protein n=1 Tax=Anguilla anguilla TaxID=7936 RepID=A0A0E9TPQ9_ANGAN